MTDICISIDSGGTFNDSLAEYTASDGSRQRKVMKLLSKNPGVYEDAAIESVRRFLEDITGVEYPKGTKIPKSAPLTRVRLGTTVATNALLERKGCDVLFITTEGLEDVIEIGTQSRPNIFALDIIKPTPIHTAIIGAPERVLVIPNADTYNTLESHLEAFPYAQVVTSTTTKEQVIILKPLDVEQITKQLQSYYDKNPSYSLAIALAHSYAYPEHEIQIKEIAHSIGFKNVSISSSLTSSIKLLARAHTVTADAYLTPILQEYCNRFLSGFDDELLQTLDVKFMRSDGGLTDAKNFSGHCSLLSGPAGGYLGLASTSIIVDEKNIPKSNELIQLANTTKPIVLDEIPSLLDLLGSNVPAIGVDVGGTSSDCCISDGTSDMIFHNVISGVDIVTPSLNVSTLASGGGSILEFENGLFHVGPHSAGSYPGPSCYNQTPTAPLAITDANCITGKINPQYFPAIFGPKQDSPLSKETAEKKFEILAQSINQWKLTQYQLLQDQQQQQQEQQSQLIEKPEQLTIEQIALGFLAVSYEQIGRGIKNLIDSRGLDCRLATLAAFGGAGAQSCCGIADNLNMNTIHIHSLSSILSAFGIHRAPIVDEAQSTLNMYLNDSAQRLTQLTNELTLITKEKLLSMSVKPTANIKTITYLSLKYETTDTALTVELTPEIITNLSATNNNELNQLAYQSIEELFFQQYRIEFGFLLERKIIVESIRIRSEAYDQELELTYPQRTKSKPIPADHLRLFVGTKSHPSQGQWYENVPLYKRDELEAGVVLPGPCYIIDRNTTIIVEPSWTAFVLWDSITLIKQGQIIENENNNNIIEHQLESQDKLTVITPEDARAQFPCDPILLSLFQNRFMSITDQMCRVLCKTASSVNIKTRLDFSCALFTGEGALVQSAPNLPVHLGSLSTCVTSQIEYAEKNNIPWFDGDVIITNDPRLGGSHLPDITILTPLFLPQSNIEKNSTQNLKPFLFFAARGHHADVGSISAGSMPSNSQHLCQEGVNIASFKVVKGSHNNTVPLFDEAGLTTIFTSPGSCGHKECVGTRCLPDNLNDIRAQIAANTRGVRLMKQLLQLHGINKVMAYMLHIQSTAEQSSRDLLRLTATRHYQRCNNIITNKQSIELPEIVTLDPSIDYMDDGTPIQLVISINTKTGDAIFDFDGTGPQVAGNTNTPLSVTRSAIIYSLRTMIERNIPLNQGILFPITIKIPPNTILSPSPTSAVVGGNVLTSQRITDIILYAFQAASNSSGCMNNFTFGIPANNDTASSFGYYETICGGIGATERSNGCNATHCHMTNTTITDVEIMERKYAVLLRRFQVRQGSGGNGIKTGGCGVIREVQFLRDGIEVNILSERRALAPNGLLGGGNGLRGQNLKIDYSPSNPGEYIYDLTDADKILCSLGGKNAFISTKHQGIRILTPGGGGWGNINKLTNHQVKLLNQNATPSSSSTEQIHRETTIIGSVPMFHHIQDTQ